jgi:4-amino-4-deoxy-L-arabinose transferase-like glycosyltransferase
LTAGNQPESRTTLLVVAGVLGVLFFLQLGSFGLWDPWESHYAEVAREILQSGDAIRLHWQREWFFSKPVLSFWLMALSMKLFGVNSGGPDELVRSDVPEWAIRLPFALVSLLGLLCLYAALAPRMGRRAAAFGAIAAGTATQVLFIARQAITDMLFVGLMCLAIAAYLVSLDAGDDDPAPVWPVPLGGRTLRLPLAGLALGAVALAVLPQLLMIAGTLYARTYPNLRMQDPMGMGGWPHMAPFLVGLAVLLGLGTRLLRGARECWLLLAYLAAGLAVLAKGIPGLALPLGVLGVWLLLTGELKRELTGRMLTAHAVGLGVVVLVAAPWFLAMNISFPGRFVSEFFGQHHWKRLAEGVHGERGGPGYYLPWLTIGAFPWTGLGVAGLLAAMRLKRGPARDPAERASQARLFLGVWTLVCFGVFTLVKTKFHHYILPATLPLAFLGGAYLDVLIGASEPPTPPAKEGASESASPRPAEGGSWRTVALALLAIGLAIYGYVALQIVEKPIRLIWLYVYNYTRPWPQTLDYRQTLKTLTVLGALPLSALATAVALAAGPRLVRAAALAVTGFAVFFALFLGQKYQLEVAPHWAQKELMLRYFDLRSPEHPEPLLAWQMNWRGETFYTKSTEAPYVALNNTAVRSWLARQPQGQRIFIIFEKQRLHSLKSKVLSPEAAARLKLLSSIENNKFYLAETVLGSAAPPASPPASSSPDSSSPASSPATQGDP